MMYYEFGIYFIKAFFTEAHLNKSTLKKIYIYGMCYNEEECIPFDIGK